jgi:hypothetical protein
MQMKKINGEAINGPPLLRNAPRGGLYSVTVCLIHVIQPEVSRVSDQFLNSSPRHATAQNAIH